MAARRPSLTLGVEEEYLLADPETGRIVTDPPEEVMEACRRELGEEVKHELLRAQIEVNSRICRDVAEVRAELVRMRAAVVRALRRFGLTIVATSTHPLVRWREQRTVDMDRYRILTEDFQALARRLAICGMHVHAGIEDEDLRIDLLRQIGYFLPHLLALSTSSPFWEGQPTGLKAFRPTIFGDLPRTGFPEDLESWSEWQRLLRVMEQCGVCDDATKIWWDVRPSVKQPTLEMRACDICTRLEDVVCIAALYQCILRMLFDLRARNQRWRIYRRILLEENKWRAQRWGVEAKLADYGELVLKPMPELVEELVALLRPAAEELGCVAEVEHAREIVRRGTSGDTQLRIYHEARRNGADDQRARQEVACWLVQATLEGVDT